MLAKLIVWGPDRPSAVDRMQRALRELVLTGVATNAGFHERLFADAEFRRGEFDIQFLERRPDLAEAPVADTMVEQLAVLAALAEDQHRGTRPRGAVADAPSSGVAPWALQGRLDVLR